MFNTIFRKKLLKPEGKYPTEKEQPEI